MPSELEPIYKCRGGGYAEDLSECPEGVDGVLDARSRVRLSKLLSGLLRHYPWRAGVKLDRKGWAPLDRLLEGIRGLPGFEWVERWHIEAIALLDPKGRFEIRGHRIRARYGHSVPVEVEPLPGETPRILYHGTPASNLNSILREGIRRMKRVRVHLSPTIEAAVEVGSRRSGVVAVIEVDVECLERMGYRVEKASPVVYTVEYVPRDCIKGHRILRA